LKTNVVEEVFFTIYVNFVTLESSVITSAKSYFPYGFTRYYHIFIESFSKLSYTITSLQKKGIKFKWTEKCQESFERFKHLLTTTPILRIENPQMDFVVYIDASLEGL